MNSDKAAAVRDSVNGCPEVIDPEDSDLVEKDGEPFTTHRRKTFTGDRVKSSRSFYRPAYIEQSGSVGNGDGATRPVYVVVLEPLWHKTNDVRSLSPELVFEIAKHDCRVRFYPPEHRLGGAIWICDHFSQDITDADGDRCPDCGSTYWKLQDDEPECAKCGRMKHPESETRTPKIEDYVGGNS